MISPEHGRHAERPSSCSGDGAAPLRPMRAHSKPRRPSRPAQFLQAYTHGLTREDVQRLFTRDTREAYRFFARSMDEDALGRLPWHRAPWSGPGCSSGPSRSSCRPPGACSSAWPCCLPSSASFKLFRGFDILGVPIFLGVVIVNVGLPAPQWEPGTVSLLHRLPPAQPADPARGCRPAVAQERPRDRARHPVRDAAAGRLRRRRASRPSASRGPANTVGGDFYDVLTRPDGRVVVTLGDVPGKGSPAALLMALLLAMFRTLVDEGLEAGRAGRAPERARSAATRRLRASSRCSSRSATRPPADWSM